jgi:hypothetical protein
MCIGKDDTRFERRLSDFGFHFAAEITGICIKQGVQSRGFLLFSTRRQDITYRRKETPFPRVCQRFFALKKLFFSRLVAGVDGGKLNQA